MISIVIAINDLLEKTYLPMLLESITRLPKVSEVILAKYDCDPFHKEEVKDGRRIITFCTGVNLGKSPAEICASHALNIHAAIDLTTNDLVMTSDGDIFFYPNTDVFYKNLMDKYSINIIGCSHPAATTQAFTYFPTIINALFRKTELPGENFLIEHLYMSKVLGKGGLEGPIPGKYLVPTEICGKPELFPNPSGHYETGCNLFLWAKEKNWKWLSFQTPDIYNYTTQYFRTNFGLKDKLPRRGLIYHAVGGSSPKPSTEKFDSFKEAYEAMKDEYET